LWWHYSRGNDGGRRVHEEEDENFPVAGYCRVPEVKRLDLVLEEVGEHKASSLIGGDMA